MEVLNKEDRVEIVFLRHSEAGQNKSKSKNPAEDFSRRLTQRGIEQCADIAEQLVIAEKGGFDFVICSPTERTKETLQIIKQRMGDTFGKPEVIYEPRLYTDSWEQVFDLIKKIPKWAKRVLVLGHDVLKKVIMLLAGSKRNVSDMRPGDYQILYFHKSLGWENIAIGCAKIGESTKALAAVMAR